MRIAGWWIAAALAAGAAGAAENGARSFVWLDADANLGVGHARVSAADLGLPGSWSVEKTVLRGGKQEGVDVVYVDNGRAEFTLVPTRGMSVWEARCGDSRMGWDSIVDQVVHPNYIDLESRNGLGWLEGFAGWLVRCGMEFAGHPGMDEAVNNVGAVIQTPLTLHGKVDYLPASRLEIRVDAEPPHAIHVIGEVREQMMFGPKLKLVSRFTTRPGSTVFEIHDEVTNESGRDSEMMMIYHPNFGPPLLEKGARLYAALERVTPRDGRAAEYDPEAFFRYGGPEPGYVEQVYFLKPKTDADGYARVLLANRAGDRGARMGYGAGTLPCLTVWKNTAAMEDGYVTGLEPGTSYPNNRKLERKNGNVPVLGAGESIRFDLEFEFAMDAGRVEAIRREIEELQGEEPPRFDPEPVEGISY